MGSVRNSNIELLRILAMFAVIFLHINEYAAPVANDNSYVKFLFVFLESCCISAVDIFVIISGYFLSNKNDRSVGKALGLIFLFSFFNVFFYLWDVLNELDVFVINVFVRKLIPTSYFVTLYVVLYYLSPFVNRLIDALADKECRNLMILLFLVFSLYATGVDLLSECSSSVWYGVSPVGIWGNQQGFNIVNFLFLYVVGAYIRRFELPKRLDCLKVPLWLLCILLIFVWAIICEHLHIHGLRSAWVYHNPFVILSAALLFVIFRSINIKSKVVNFFAKSAFPVYVIHPFLLKKIAWSDVGTSLFADVLFVVSVIIFVYLFSTAMYMVYRVLFFKLFNYLDKIFIRLIDCNKAK